MFQRWVSKLRPFLQSSQRALLHSSPHSPNPLPLRVNTFIFNPLFSTSPKPQLPGFQSLSHLYLNQMRCITTKERRMKKLTPIVSKVKKYKIKGYSSYKSRFRVMNDGKTIRRWHAGKRHNAHLKSKISKRRLRAPALVHPAYAKVMKKLNFCN